MSTTATRTPEAVPIERAPTPVPVEPGIAMPPDTLGYQLKRRLLGPPLRNEQLEEERLGKPTALAVFASDNLSSSAYATEEILRVLVPAVGVAAFSLVVPITLAMLGVLAVLILSYRQTIVLVPVMVVFLVRLSRQYETEDAQLEDNVPEAIAAPLLRRHIVLVFIDRLDLAAARAIQYARTLMPDDLRAVHFAIDQQRADELTAAWARHGMARIALDISDCPDRRLPQAAVEVVARDLSDGQTEVSVLLPDWKYRGFWHRILHDQTADAIERAVSGLPHANVTTVPFHFTGRKAARGSRPAVEPTVAATTSRPMTAPSPRGVSDPAPPTTRADGARLIGTVTWRQSVHIEGRMRTLRVRQLAGTATLECVLADDTGAISLVFLGRDRIPGIEVGTRYVPRAQPASVEATLPSSTPSTSSSSPTTETRRAP
jgi:hypothetical protein